MAVVVGRELAEVERAVEQAELPELVGDVLAGVRDRAVGADQDLVRLVHPLELGALVELHHPAVFVFAFRLLNDGAAGFEQLERAVPEMERDDVALFRQQVVRDAEAEHRGDVALHDGAGDRRGEFERVAFVLLDLVQRVAPPLLRLGIGRVVAAIFE